MGRRVGTNIYSDERLWVLSCAVLPSRLIHRRLETSITSLSIIRLHFRTSSVYPDRKPYFLNNFTSLRSIFGLAYSTVSWVQAPRVIKNPILTPLSFSMVAPLTPTITADSSYMESLALSPYRLEYFSNNFFDSLRLKLR